MTEAIENVQDSTAAITGPHGAYRAWLEEDQKWLEGADSDELYRVVDAAKAHGKAVKIKQSARTVATWGPQGGYKVLDDQNAQASTYGDVSKAAQSAAFRARAEEEGWYD